MNKSRREERREETILEIRSLAWQQLAQVGPADLSLRAISREMRMSSPAIFRYFPNRDALLSDLSQDAFRSINEFIETALRAVPADRHARRMATACQAFRTWALDNPEKYSLVYGAPVVGFNPDTQIFHLDAKHGLDIFIDLILAAGQAGAAQVPALPENFPPGLARQLQKIAQDRAAGVTPALVYLALAGWTRLHGIISLEAYGHLDTLLPDAGDLYRQEIHTLLSRAGYQDVPPDLFDAPASQESSGTQSTSSKPYEIQFKPSHDA